MKVWIDQDLCTGDGLCTEICPDIFFMHDDGLAYVKDVDSDGYGPDGAPRSQMAQGHVEVLSALEEAVIDAAEECPGECIFIET
jgi:ferredoxin